MAFGLFYVGIRFFCCIFSRRLGIATLLNISLMRGSRIYRISNLDIEIEKASVTSTPKLTIFCELNNTYKKTAGKFNVGLVNSFAISYLEVELILL